MKKVFYPSLLLASALTFASSAKAVDWYLDYTIAGNQNVTFSSTLGSASDAGNQGWWYKMVDGEKEYIKGGSIAATDKLIFGDNTQSGSPQIKLDMDLTVAGMEMNANGTSRPIRFYGDVSSMKNLTINGDIIRSGTKTTDVPPKPVSSTPNFDGLNVLINGAIQNNSIGTSDGWGNFEIFRAYQIKITEGLVGGRAMLSANGTVKERMANGTNTFENGLANPDIVLGRTKLDGYFFKTCAGSNDFYYQLDGLTGSVGAVSDESSKGQLTNIILANTSNASTGYTIREYGSNTGLRTAWGKVRIVMNSANGSTQDIVGNNSWAGVLTSGGITVISGTLRVNFNQLAKLYTYYTVKDTTVVSFITKNDGSKIGTTYSHGDLVMQGGAFSSLTQETNDKETTYGSFRFTNIKYSGGKIILRMKDNANFDSIDLTSYYELTTISGVDQTPVLVEGGKVIREGINKVTFDFGSALPWWLVDEGDGNFTLNGGLGAKIIAWDAGKGEGLSASDFAANSYQKVDDYTAAFTVGEDGLYVKYVVVPEASTIAAILGALALGFAAYRRRK